MSLICTKATSHSVNNPLNKKTFCPPFFFLQGAGGIGPEEIAGN
jgi:hypothetical protein